MLKIFLLFFHFGNEVLAGCSSSEQSHSPVAVLREKLFCNYDKNIRPVKQHSDQMIIYVALHPIKINMDEFQEEITVKAYLEYNWNDTYLKWNPKEYDNIQYILSGIEKIWTPNLMVDTGSKGIITRPTSEDCFIEYMGKISCAIFVSVSVYCTVDLLKFPFDRQKCTLNFIVPHYREEHIDLKVYYEGISMLEYHRSKVWEISNISLVRGATDFGDNSSFHPHLQCDIMLERRSAGQEAIILGPGLVLSALTLTTFLMGDLHESRINLSTLTFLCNLMYCLYFGYRLPSNGNEIPFVVKFFRDSLVISGVSVAVTVFVHLLRKITSPPGSLLSNLILKIQVSPMGKLFLSSESYAGAEDAAGIIQDGEKKCSSFWPMLANLLDRIVFLTCIFVYFLLFLLFLS